jgi:hypothetical protein
MEIKENFRILMSSFNKQLLLLFISCAPLFPMEKENILTPSNLNEIKQDIEEKFTANMVPIQQAKIIAFPEIHNRHEHMENIIHLLNLFPYNNAVLLLEGYQWGTIILPEQLITQHLNINPIIMAKGWDDLASQKEDLEKLLHFLKTANEARREGTLATITLPSIHDQKKDLITRNKSMIHAISQELAQDKIVYVIFGRDHYFAEEAGKELRDFLKAQNALILIPKNIEKKYSPEIQKEIDRFGKRLRIMYSQFSLGPTLSFDPLNEEEMNIQIPFLIKALKPTALILDNPIIKHQETHRFIDSLSQTELKHIIIKNPQFDADITIEDIIDNAPTTTKIIMIEKPTFYMRSLSNEQISQYAQEKGISLSFK